jgi:pyruvate/2-oxoglutarate dehydrogenase complex dihydrolipoamide dehydrogenase (E3) component
MAAHASPLVLPLDEHNRALLARVHPPEWRNPTPAPRYDLVVLGGGTAGLVSAAGAASLGARVALVERRLLGGDCLNVGCVPSKALLRSARAVGDARQAAVLGVDVGTPRVDFGATMKRMRERRAAISPNDSAQRLSTLGVDVFFGEAHFTGPRSIRADGAQLQFRRAIIATGGRPTAPPVDGLAGVPYLTNETLFWLTELPRRLLIIGAGPIGCEMAQAFARFGSAVTVLDVMPRILPREDPDAAAIVERRLTADGIRFELWSRLREARTRDGSVSVRFERNRESAPGGGGAPPLMEVTADALLVAAGRAPNVEELDLGAAGVEATEQGVVVNDRLQTSNRRIFAAGDVCSQYKFTHAADAMARIAIQNALFFGRKRASALVIPWTTYTDPEVAHVGRYAHDEPPDAAPRLETITVPLDDVDRALLDEQAEGFVRVHHVRGRLAGCTIVAAHAGELIAEACYAITRAGTLDDLSATIHPYPTQAEALRKAGDAYRRTLLTPSLRRWFDRYFRLTRSW